MSHQFRSSISVLSTLVASFSSSLGALSEGPVKVATKEMSRLVMLLGIIHLGLIVLVAVLTTFVSGFRGSLRALDECPIGVTARRVRGISTLVLCSVDSLGGMVFVAVQAAFVTRLGSCFGTFGEGAIRVTASGMRTF
jgi:hypothetical protein